MSFELLALFFEQSCYIDNRPCKDEFEAMCLIFELIPKSNKEKIEHLSLQWIRSLEDYENKEFGTKNVGEKIKKSKDLRQNGNQLINCSENKRSVLGACSLYNDAIYVALDTESEELALGFANRGLALQTFGYYQQAYDDCVLALRLGYPLSKRYKIILRQIFCAIKLKDIQKAETHFNELKQINLNSSCLKQYKDLEADLEILKQEYLNGKVEMKTGTPIPLNRDSQEIITTTEKGRCMIAACAIEKNQLIFNDRIQAALPIGDTRRICRQCLTVNFIPYPCLHCRGRVNYCSIKCQDEHANVHTYECRAYRIQLFSYVKERVHMALRLLLDDGIFSIVDEIIKTDKSTAQVWYDMLECGNISNGNNILTYAESLKMITDFDHMTDGERKSSALFSIFLVVYLKHYTDYFKKLYEKSIKINWEILTGSLIFRHIGQSTLNTSVLGTIIPRPIGILSNSKYHMLNDKIWLSPWHLKLGCLHQFSDYEYMSLIIAPYLSLCNHSCVQSFQPRFSGRYISAYALRNFSKGDEITLCYELDYRKCKRSARRKKLKDVFHFDCKCEDCLQTTAEDVEFNKFHQYRCDNKKCGKVFVPNLPKNPYLNWWQTEMPNKRIDLNIYCTVCGCLQSLKWYHEFKQLMSLSFDSNARRRLYQIFNKLENTLIGLNDARGYVAHSTVVECFTLPLANICLNDRDYSELIKMIKYLQRLYASECSENSQEYVTVLPYLWDLIALRKYRCSKDEMDKMLLAINILDDDTKLIFLNYYNDYIKNIL